MVQTFVNFVFIIYKFEDYRNILKTRLAFTRSFDLRGNLGNVKKKQIEKLVSPVKKSAGLHASTLQNFATQHFFDVNEVSIVFS